MTGVTTDSGDALLRRMAARRRRDNVIFGVLAALAVLGGLSAIGGFLFSSTPEGPSDATTMSSIGHAELAGSFAADFVTTYLSATSGQQDQIGRYVSAGQITLPATGQRVTEPSVVFVRRTNTAGTVELWTVTVSVRVEQSGGAATGARQYYRVPVSVSDSGTRALALPALVTPPGAGIDLALKYTQACAPDTPVSTVANGFLAAYLASSGDVNRYTTVDSGITALSPAPFSAIEPVTVSADDSRCGAGGSTTHVLATVAPHTASGNGAPLAYPLTMVDNGGQWQVRTMDSVPTLTNPIAQVAKDGPQQSAAETTSTTATPSVTIPPATHN